MNWRQLLWPFSLIFGAVTAVRNLAFEQGWLRGTRFDVPVIAVGNLSTGGTGKTPMVEFLIKNLRDKKLGFVSRGYGRKTKGLIRITGKHSPSEIGDEPFQVFQKHPQLAAAVSEKRTEGINAVCESSAPDVILLDDAFQHRYVKASLNILLTTFQKPFYEDQVLPAGNLRESRSGKERADLIIVTKCPLNLSEQQKKDITQKISPTNYQAVFFSGLEYLDPQNHHGSGFSEKPQEITVLTGIANPTPMLAHLRKNFKVKAHWKYPDHHAFKARDLERIRKSDTPTLTTEKDWVRLKPLLKDEDLERIFYLPLKVRILFGESENLMQLIRGKV